MGRRLTTYVHVVELDTAGAQTGRSAVLGPNDEVPDWAAAAITNPKVWADTDDEPVPPQAPPTPSGDPAAPGPEPTEPPANEVNPAPTPGPVSLPAPPRSGSGSGTPAWAAYAAVMGVEVAESASRADIIAALDAAGIATQ